MNKLNFAYGKKTLAAYIAAGDPDLEHTARYIEVLQRSGVDVVEVGLPFSDPVADSAEVQNSQLRALERGVNADGVFDMLGKIEKTVPFVLVTYANPVYIYGYDAFFKKCGRSGISAVVISDMPFEESAEIKPIADKYGVTVIDTVAVTSGKRIESICAESTGFINLSMPPYSEDNESVIDGLICAVHGKIRGVCGLPVLVDCGVKTVEQAAGAAKQADGVILNSTIVSIIDRFGGSAAEELGKFLTEVAQAVHNL